jgi:hypothetical protein
LELGKRIGSLLGTIKRYVGVPFCGIGEATILEYKIMFEGYPFEPSTVYKNGSIKWEDVDEIHLGCFPPTLKIGPELVFIERGKLAELKVFAERHELKQAKRNSNWDWITEPFLDTEFSPEEQRKTIEFLSKNGITESETMRLREEISEQMVKYNFDTMLWEWCSLGLSDVLSAMRAKYDKSTFEKFYWRAMEIEMRGEVS